MSDDNDPFFSARARVEHAIAEIRRVRPDDLGTIAATRAASWQRCAAMSSGRERHEALWTSEFWRECAERVDPLAP